MKTKAALLLVLFLTLTFSQTIFPQHLEAKSIKILAPAVARTESGERGVLIEITVTFIRPGSGKVYVSTMPLTEIDMQASVYTAAKVAHRLAGIPFSNYDYLIYIKSPAVIVGGPSASAYIAVAIYALLTNSSLKEDISMTGFIAPDGTIGPVGGILEKIEASSKIGVKTFLVPAGQTVDYEIKVVTKKIGPFTISTITREKVNVAEIAYKKWGIKVVEVWSLKQAVEYFTGKSFKKPEIVEKPPEKYLITMKTMAKKLLEKTSSLLENLSDTLGKSYMKKLEDKINTAKALLGNKPYVAYLILRSILSELYYSDSIEKWNKGGVSALRKILDIIEAESAKYLELAEKATQVNAFKAALLSEEVSSAEIAILSALRAYKSFQQFPLVSTLKEFLRKIGEARAHVSCASAVAETISVEEAETTVLEKQAAILLSEAKSAVAYAATLVENPSLLPTAETYLELAQKAYREKLYFSTCIRALKALVYATVELNLISIRIGGALEKYLAYSRSIALEALSEAQVNSTLLTYGYFEYAEETEDYVAKLLYYKMASFYTKTLISLTGETKTATPKVEKNEESAQQTPLEAGEDYIIKYILLIALVVMVGVIVFYVIKILLCRRGETL